MTNAERSALPGVPRLPEGFYYEVVRADHAAVLVKVRESGTSRRPSTYDRTVASREIGETEDETWPVQSAEERIKTALTIIGNEWIKKHNENLMTESMRRYVGAFDAAGAPL